MQKLSIKQILHAHKVRPIKDNTIIKKTMAGNHNGLYYQVTKKYKPNNRHPV